MEIDIFRMCRVCLNDSGAYSNVFEVLLSDNYLYEVLNDVCQLEVKSDDGLPQFLCCECYQKLEMFDSFKRLSQEGSSTLQSWMCELQNVQVKVEPVFYESEYMRGDDDGRCLEERCIEGDEETAIGEGFTCVQTELYLPVKSEVQETFPVSRTTDPLKDDSNAGLEDPLGYEEDSNACGWFSKVQVKSEPDLYDSECTVEEIDERRRCLEEGASVCGGGRNRQSGSGVGEEGTTGGRYRFREGDTVPDGEAGFNREASAGEVGGPGVGFRLEERGDVGERLGERPALYPRVKSGSGGRSSGGEGEGFAREEAGIIAVGSDSAGDLNASRSDCNVRERDFPDHSELHYVGGSGPREASWEGDPYECNFCKETFSEVSDLKSHLRAHTREKVFKCDRCDKAFFRFQGLKRHESAHSEDAPHRCPHCGDRFQLECRLKKHLAVHTGQKPFKCDWCEKSYDHRSQLKRHLTLHTAERAFECGKCGKAFVTGYNLRKHVAEHDTEKPYRCGQCDRRFSLALNLADHERKHARTREKRFRCDSCRKCFRTGAELRRHLMVHANEKPYRCSTCGKAFAQPAHVKRHEVLHTGVRSIACRWCGKAFADSSGRSRHEKTHTEDRKHACTECGKSFTMKSYLKIHMSIHSERRCFQCGRCPKTFSSRSNLKRHEVCHAEGAVACLDAGGSDKT